MTIRVKEDTANKTTFASINDAPKRIRQGLRIALTEIGKENVMHGKGLIKKGPKTGKFYQNHQASAPGEAPASRTGRLLLSLRYRVYGWDRMEFGYYAPHGKFLEDGTKFMEPRPVLVRTADEKSRDNYNSLARETGKRIIKE